MKTKKVAMVVTILIILVMLVTTLMEYITVETNKEPVSNQVVFEYDGKKVYENELTPYITYYLKMNGKDNTDARNAAVDNYIRSSLFDTFAKDLGITVEDKAVSDYITASPIFKEDGKTNFSQAKYDAFISSIGIRKNVFENEVRKDLTIVKLMEKLDGINGINDYYFNIMNDVLAQNRVIEKIKVNFDDIPVNFTEEDIAKRYEATKNNYKKPDNIVFSKYTYIHPDNQSDEKTAKDMMTMETETFYNELSKLKGNLFLDKLTTMNLKKSNMTLNSLDFGKLTGSKDTELETSTKVEFQKGYNYIDKSEVSNGVVTIYHIDDITSNGLLSLDEAYPTVKKELIAELKIDAASKVLKDNKGDMKNSLGKYFVDYKEELINPLKNDQTPEFYKAIYSLPINGIGLISDKGGFYFVKLKDIDKTVLTKEQIDYFRTSQENIYKQFILMSTYESLQSIYHLKKYKKES